MQGVELRTGVGYNDRPIRLTRRNGMRWKGLIKQTIHKMYITAKKLPGIGALAKTNAWKLLRFKITLHTSNRRNCNFTSFLRLPTQFEALSGPVLDFLFQDRTRKELKIIVMGCSNGAEPYSIASILRKWHPSLEFTIYAYDIEQECIDRARSARYTSEEVSNNEKITSMTTSDFVNDTFDRVDGYYVVKSDIRKHVHFDVADALDPKLRDKLGTSDIVYAQHFLIHLQHRQAVEAFKNIYRLLNSRSALFIAGVEHDMLVKLTKKYNLKQCEYKVEEIHKEVGLYGKGWPYVYHGCEPFMTVRKNWQRRYSTIFIKS